jgi:hypothetical protein
MQPLTQIALTNVVGVSAFWDLLFLLADGTVWMANELSLIPVQIGNEADPRHGCLIKRTRGGRRLSECKPEILL